MVAFTEQDFEEISLIESATLLSIAIEPKTSPHWVKGRLEILARDAQDKLGHEECPHARLKGLIELFFGEWKFKGDFEQYFSSENTFIEKVLRRRKGIPISLGAVLLFIAHRLDLPLKPVGFPTQLILKADWVDRPAEYINPFDGHYLTERTLRGWLIGKDGPNTQLLPEYLNETPHKELIERWLNVMKNSLLREEQFVIALRCSELALALTPNDPYEIRDRGYIFQQLDCDWVAADDYEYFISQGPEDPAAEVLKL